jgi:hypothetical protein
VTPWIWSSLICCVGNCLAFIISSKTKAAQSAAFVLLKNTAKSTGLMGISAANSSPNPLCIKAIALSINTTDKKELSEKWV